MKPDVDETVPETKQPKLTEVQLGLLSDHYKETFAYQREYLKFRDRLFVFILIAVVILLFQLYSPTEAEIALTELISDQLDIQSTIDISFLGSVTWFIILGLVMRYCQTVITIERGYKYIAKLEARLSDALYGAAFSREGKHYAENHAWFSDWTFWLYQGVFPILLLVILSFKIGREWYVGQSISLILLFNTMIYSLICVLVILYLIQLHIKKKPEDKNDKTLAINSRLEAESKKG